MSRIAIVGIGCRYAGGIDSPQSFWDFVVNKNDGAIGDIPADRWDYRRFYDSDKGAAGKMYTKRGAFLDCDPWQFDPEFFGISPREATSMDPQQRLIMEVAWEAADDAGVAGRLSGSGVGVYVGAFNVDFSVTTMAASAVAHIDMNTSTAASFTMLSNRLAYALNLMGPALTVDTACSSSLVAFHLACQGIANGDCDMALAGGVNLMLQPETFVSMCKGGFLAVDGRSKPFSARADGYGRGEGAGMVVLRRLEDALRDGDRIYAVVEATGTNQDGRTSAITVPNGKAQEALARSVCARSGIAAHQVTYVEAHGTGTPVGDPIELGALGRVYGCVEGRTKPLSVGSLKATLGHTEAASGIASVIKGALAIYHRILPPQGWFDDPNPDIAFDELRLSVQVEPEAVDAAVDRMSVAINGFGYGGTNAHAILAELDAPVAPNTPAVPSTRRDAGVFPLSARSEAATRKLAGTYADLVEAGTDPGELIEAAWSRRAHHRHRAGVAFTDSTELTERLRQISSGAARSVRWWTIPRAWSSCSPGWARNGGRWAATCSMPEAYSPPKPLGSTPPSRKLPTGPSWPSCCARRRIPELRRRLSRSRPLSFCKWHLPANWPSSESHPVPWSGIAWAKCRPPTWQGRCHCTTRCWSPTIGRDCRRLRPEPAACSPSGCPSASWNRCSATTRASMSRPSTVRRR
ncbi:beta-ketoacyl synthase, C-terminal domain protein [Mycobacterium kansasii]|uniref:Beta-ketoacyl synthase, C-terminal domain protein n=1 Tax=Mycobacterium kansasii TaxID=1768 RepID=A0A1V3XZI3_MYCKA|nr:beta-ketoacyl synthase, C-terminal domain protein [Mycobacterium kansasii]